MPDLLVSWRAQVKGAPFFRCAEHFRQLGGESPFYNLMEVKMFEAIEMGSLLNYSRRISELLPQRPLSYALLNAPH